MLTDLLTVAVLGFIGTRLVGAARLAVSPPGRQRWSAVVRGLRARHFVLAVPVLLLVLAAAFALLQVPGLSFGWWTAVGGEGNPVFGQTTRHHDSAFNQVIPIVFLALLLPTLPLFALREEEVFRAGAESRTTRQRAWWAVKFGLVHALIGIPIGVALALSIGGAYFTWVYVREWRRSHAVPDAVLESARAHLAYNLTIVALVVVSLAAGAV